MTRILIVEDDPEMRELIGITLDDPALTIAGEAASAEEALTIAPEVQPDVIILDHFLDGEITGLQLAPRLPELVPASKILFFSSHDLQIEVEREPSVHGYLRKAQVSRLLEAVRALYAA
jgi:two-component system, NarL family, nitrate/nitrite response regulator NarL